jgi:tetratricopeptide (TPR) repeat protein
LTFDDMRDFALGLRTRLIDEPNDPIGWMLLGRVSGALNRADSAIEAFERSIELDPNNVGTLTSYAQALLMVGQEAQLQTAERALSRVLSIEPDNVSALGMLAVVTSELGKFNESLTHWTRLQGFIGESDPNYAAVTEKIAKMRAALNQQEPATEAEPAGKTANKVEVTVSLSESLKDKLPSSGVIFVFAQGLSGSKMPAAVVKLPLADFPITVSLSDDNAMVQGYNLSQLTQARIVARISADENVALATGELQGEQLVDFTSQINPEVAITINKEEP